MCTDDMLQHTHYFSLNHATSALIFQNFWQVFINVTDLTEKLAEH